VVRALPPPIMVSRMVIVRLPFRNLGTGTVLPALWGAGDARSLVIRRSKARGADADAHVPAVAADLSAVSEGAAGKVSPTCGAAAHYPPQPGLDNKRPPAPRRGEI
jgi:hypothetical protein